MPKKNDGEYDRANSALAEGLYWYAEKLMWDYEGVEKNPREAFKLYRQAAELGFSDATVRLGQLQEFGKGTECDPRAAIRSYQAAAKAGNFYALAYLAQLLSRTTHLEKSDAVWTRFFQTLKANPEKRFLAATRGELLHNYITTQLRLGLNPRHLGTLRRYRLDIMGHHQQLLEHTPDERIERLDGPYEWMALNL